MNYWMVMNTAFFQFNPPQPTKVALPQKEPEEQGLLFVPGVSPWVLVKGLHMDDRLVLDAARLTLVVEWL